MKKKKRTVSPFLKVTEWRSRKRACSSAQSAGHLCMLAKNAPVHARKESVWKKQALLGWSSEKLVGKGRGVSAVGREAIKKGLIPTVWLRVSFRIQ